MIMRKGSECTGVYLLDWYKGAKYHIADRRNRLYLCGCDKSGAIEHNLGIGRNLRHRFKRPNRVSEPLEYYKTVTQTPAPLR